MPTASTELRWTPIDWIYPGWTLEWLLRCARSERCCLNHYWHQGGLLSADEQRQLGQALEEIDPTRLPSGHPCEARFEMKPRHWKRIAEAAERESGDGAGFVRAAKRKPLICKCGCGTEFTPSTGRQKYANAGHAQHARNAKRQATLRGTSEKAVSACKNPCKIEGSPRVHRVGGQAR